MVNAVAQHSITHGFRELLARKFRRVYADDDQFVGKCGFEFAQLRECVHAVDSTECPEVENSDMPAQFANMQRVIAIDPVQAVRKVRRSYLAAKLCCCHAMLHL